MVLIGLCLLAFGLRVARLDFHPIWFDEDLAYQRATATLAVSLASMAGSPLYYILLRGWVQVAGASLFALRYFSMLWGTLTIPLIYQVTRRWLGGQIALATTLIAVFAPFYIYYSQEARTYLSVFSASKTSRAQLPTIRRIQRIVEVATVSVCPKSLYTLRASRRGVKGR